MTTYAATIEVATKKLDIDTAMDALAPYSPSLSQSPRGWATATISIPATTLAQAAATATAVVAGALGADAIAATVMTEAERDARQGFEPMPELVSVTEATEILGGVSRQAVLDRITRGTLPATKVGREYVIPRSALRHA